MMDTDDRHVWREAVLFLSLFGAATVLFTWPLVRYLGDGYLTQTSVTPEAWFADPFLITWGLAWATHAVLTDPLHIMDANVAYPFPHSLRFCVQHFGTLPITVPIGLLSDNPVHLHNGVILASYALGGAAMACLLRDLGTSRIAAIVGGALFVFGPARDRQLTAAHLLSTWGMPLALLCLHRLLRTGRWRAGLGFAVFLAMQALTSLHHAGFFGLAVVLFIGLDFVFHHDRRHRFHARALVWGAIAAIPVAATFVGYLDARERYALGRPAIHVLLESASVDYYLDALWRPLAYFRGQAGVGRQWWLAIGLSGLALAAVAAWSVRRDSRRRTTVLVYGSLTLVFAILSLGPRMRWTTFGTSTGIPGPYQLLALLPGWGALRHPVHMSIVVNLGAAVLAGIGADAALGWRRRGGARRWAVIVLAALVAFDCRPRLYVTTRPSVSEPRPVDRWLAAQPGDFAIVELPIGAPEVDAAYMVNSTRHWKRLANADLSIHPPGPRMEWFVRDFPSARSIRDLHDLGIRYVVLHADGRQCLATAQAAGPWLQLRPLDDRTCVFEVRDAPPPPPEPQLDRVPTPRLSASSGPDVAAAADGRLETHWRQPVDLTREDWLQMDLPAPHRLTRVRMRLGPHYGDYLRGARIDVSADGVTWTVHKRLPRVEPPLRQMRRDPDDLWIDLDFPPVRTAHLRVVRPASPELRIRPVFEYWPYWGVHELELYETARVRSAPADAAQRSVPSASSR